MLLSTITAFYIIGMNSHCQGFLLLFLIRKNSVSIFNDFTNVDNQLIYNKSMVTVAELLDDNTHPL